MRTLALVIGALVAAACAPALADDSPNRPIRLLVGFTPGGAGGTIATAGEVQLTFGTPPSVLPMARTGKLKVLAVTSAKRSALIPESPTIAEEGVKGYALQGWFGLFGPAKLPRSVVDRIFAASTNVLNQKDVMEKLAAIGSEAAPSASPEDFEALAIADGNKGRELLRLAGVKAE